ncbi:hypothetical protein F1880_007991 [Penicillium rolfsii]|nr:hypothetical protein F1880_007991 [Penicillium rolfsii]
MTRSLQLPNDVLLLVGEHLNDPSARWNLIFVSQHFHNLFLSLVYRTVRLDHWRDAYSFICAITKRPSLARVVRELDLSRWHREQIPQADWDMLQRSSVLKRRVKVSSHSQAETAQWVKNLEEGRGDTWTALMLPLLSQLRQLHLVYSTPSICLNRLMQRAINNKRPFQSQPFLQHLSRVSLHYQEDPDRPTAHGNMENISHEYQLALLLSFCELPSMRLVVANSVIDSLSIPIDLDLEEEKSEPLCVGRLSVTEIDLRHSCGNHGMEALIASCAGLKSFKYQHSDSHLPSTGYQPAAFYRSLTRSKRSLQTLWLDHYGDHYTFTFAGLNQTHDEWFGSLSDFSALREIRIRLPNLLDIRYQSEPTRRLIDSLPRSLEMLYIESCEERLLGMLVSQLRTVVQNRRSRLPHLRRLDIEGPFRNASADDLGHTSASTSDPAEDTIKDKIMQAVEPLHEDCALAGLELHVYDRTLRQNPHN